MFDNGLRSASDAAVVTAIEELARAEARAAARRVAAISELVRRRCGDDERAYWACDPWDAHWAPPMPPTSNACAERTTYSKRSGRTGQTGSSPTAREIF